MIALRIVAIIVVVAALLFTSRRFAQGRLRRLDLLLAWAVGFGVVALGIYPQLFEPVFDALNFTRGNNRQLLGVLVAANAVLFLLYLRNAEMADTAHRDIQSLVRALALREFDPSKYPTLEDASIVVVIPAYNEAATIGGVLARVPNSVDDHRVAALVVADGCSDETESIAREQGAVVVHAINRGQGAALLTGYQLADRLHAQVIVITDADGQTRPEELERLVRPILAGEADFVNGSRTLGEYEADSAVRALGVRVLSFGVSVLTRTKVTDVSSPFRAFRAAAVAKMHLQQPQFQASELLIEAVRQGLRYREVPITMLRRQAGETRKPGSVRYAWGFVKAVMTTWLR